MKNIPAVNEYYRDYLGNDVVILTLATDAEEGDRMVVYQSVRSGENYVITLEKFQSRVNDSKHPELKGADRFVKLDPGAISHASVDPRLEAFIDARTTSEKLEILRTMKEDATDVMLTIMGTYLDMDLENKSRDDKYNAIKNSLLMKQQYEGGRLRD